MGQATAPEYRWLIPSAVTPDADRPAPRSTRDWIIDVICFTLGFGFTVFATWDLLRDQPVLLTGYAYTPHWLIWLDAAVATITATALWWRRRYPVHVAVLLLPVGLLSITGAISGAILLFSVAVHRRFGVAATVAAAALVVNAISVWVRPDTGTAYWTSMTWSAVFMVITVLWGMVVRSRRQLLMSLRDRAERAESEQQLRVEQARSLERTRIAREMHDVLAHRISLLSLHAGALEIRPDAEAAEVARAAGVIRASAHQALQDLREVIGVLRDDPDGGRAPERPQPTLAQLPALAEESRAAGVRVSLALDLDAASVPELTGRTAYRIVQEGLTNARKHATGTAVGVAVAGAAGDGLTITVRNPAPVGGARPALPGAGTGLVGLAERTTLAGGRLDHGRTDAGEFELRAWLPWPR